MPKIVQFDQLGGPENLVLRDVAPPEPGLGEVRYKVEAWGLNYGELMWLGDRYYNSPQLPARIGSEACGIVDAVGPDITEFKVGDQVASIPHASTSRSDGRYLAAGEWAIAPARYLASWPKEVSAEKACSLWSQAITAYYCFVELAKVEPGTIVLITAGTSGSGIGAIQLAKLLGATVIATTRTGAKRDFLLKVGADYVIATDSEDLSARIREVTEGHGVDVIYDLVTGNMVSRYLEGLANGAKIYVVGGLDDIKFTVDALPLVRSAATITGFSIFNHNTIDEQLQRAKDFILKAFREGALDPIVDRVFPFSETVQAYQYLASGQQSGKIVVKVGAATSGSSLVAP